MEFKEIGKFVKPAVLALTVSKIDDINLSNKFKSLKNWLFSNDSVIKNPNDPNNTRDKLVLITSLEWRLNFL